MQKKIETEQKPVAQTDSKPALSLEQLIEYLYSKLDIQINQVVETDSNYGYVLSIEASNLDVVKECLYEIEKYLFYNEPSDIIKESKKLKYHSVPGYHGKILNLTLDSYNSSSLLKLLSIRSRLIPYIRYGSASGKCFEIEISNWGALPRSSNYPYEINHFGIREMSPPREEQELKKEIDDTLNLSKTSTDPLYRAFRISNGTFSEPYILKFSKGKIQEVIGSVSRHTSSAYHSYLFKLIKNNNPHYKMYSTLPLIHNGDCTQYSDYAVLQFDCFSEKYGQDKAFELLSKNNPYHCNREVLRDFQVLSAWCDYDPLRHKMYPLHEDVVAKIGFKPPIKSTPSALENHITTKSDHKDCRVDSEIPKENTTFKEEDLVHTSSKEQQLLKLTLASRTKIISDLISITEEYQENLPVKNNEIHPILIRLLESLRTKKDIEAISTYMDILKETGPNNKTNLQLIKDNKDPSTKQFIKGILTILAVLLTGIIPGLVVGGLVYVITDQTPMNFFKPGNTKIVAEIEKVENTIRKP